MEFWTSLVKTPDWNTFLEDNCTHVFGEYWIFEGLNEILGDELTKFEILAEGATPFLGGLSEIGLIQVCDECFGVVIDHKSDSIAALKAKLRRIKFAATACSGAEPSLSVLFRVIDEA